MIATQPNRRLRLVIVDDHTLFREGLRTILEMEDDIQVVADAESAEDIVELVWQTKPDVLLLDIRMPQGSGLDAVPAVLRISPGTKVLVLTACDEKEEHMRAFKLGAKGVIVKDSARQTLMQAIHTVCTGQVWVDPRMTGALVEELSHLGPEGTSSSNRDENGLTEREREIVRLVAQGRTGREIADELHIAHNTVRTHVRNAMTKLEADTRTQAVALALRYEFID